MNDVVANEQVDAVVAPVAALPTTAGGLLRQAREAAGLHIGALAVSMKVPVKKLEALEADRFDLFPNPVFVRALASGVCRVLRADPTPILAKLPAANAVPLAAMEPSIHTPFRSPGESVAWRTPQFLTRPGVLTVIVALVATLVIAIYPHNNGADSASSADRPAAPAPTSSAAVAAETLNPGSPPGAGTGVAAATPATASASASAANAGSANAPLLTFKARGSCWVQVADANGVVQVNRTLMTGEVLAVPATAPVSIVVGRVDAMEVEVRGQPFALAEFTKENVARFEVK